MNKLEELLLQLGLNISASAIYDFIKNRVSSGASKDELQKDLASFLSINNAQIAAETIVEFLAQNGDIEIKGSKIFAKDSIVYSSAPMTKFTLADSTSHTNKTGIVVEGGAQIVGQGGGQMRQNEDGSISFHA